MLDRDMRPTDIADALRRLKFERGHAAIIKVADAEVRDFLVVAVTGQAERSRNDLFRKDGKPPIA